MSPRPKSYLRSRKENNLKYSFKILIRIGTKKSCTVGRYDSCTIRKFWSYFLKLYIFGLVMGLYTHCKKNLEKCLYRSCKNQKNDFWPPQDPGREIWLDDCAFLLHLHLLIF